MGQPVLQILQQMLLGVAAPNLVQSLLQFEDLVDEVLVFAVVGGQGRVVDGAEHVFIAPEMQLGVADQRTKGLIENGFQPWLGDVSVERVLDLCTGSGCIGIACAHYFDMAEVDLVDISAGALEVCQQNIDRYHLNERVRSVKSDLFAGIDQRYQLIVSNPPYVDQADFDSMPPEYRHEPTLGLVSGDDGLDITRRILREASDYLTDDGILVVEVGNSEVALQGLFPDVPFLWLDLPDGGNGVFSLTAAQLREYRDKF